MVDGGGLVIGADFIGVGVFFGDGLYDLIKGLLVPAFVFLLVERGGEVGGAGGRGGLCALAFELRGQRLDDGSSIKYPVSISCSLSRLHFDHFYKLSY